MRAAVNTLVGLQSSISFEMKDGKGLGSFSTTRASVKNWTGYAKNQKRRTQNLKAPNKALEPTP